MIIIFALALAVGEVPPAVASPAWLLPWKDGVGYEFLWYEDQLVGKTSFRFDRAPDGAGIICKSTLEFSGRGSHLKGKFTTAFDPTLAPRAYMSSFSGGIGGRHGRGAGVIMGVHPDEIRVNVGATGKGPQRSFPVPRERYWLYGHHAIQHWAVFATAIDRSQKSTLKVFMPDFLRFASIVFTPQGTENIRGRNATRLDFDVEGLFAGQAWIDADGRLLRLRQPRADGALDIWIHTDSLK